MGEIKVKGKPDKKRTLSVLKGEIPDRIPYFDVLIESKHVEKIIGKFCGDTLSRGEDEIAKGAIETIPMDPKDYINVCNYTGMDMILCEAMLAPFKKDVNGKTIIIRDKSITCRKKLKEIIPPSNTDIKERIEYIKDYKNAVKGTNIGVSVKVGALLSGIYNYVTGFENFMINIEDDINFIEELLDIGAEYFSKVVKGAVKLGVDYINAGNDLAYNSGLMMDINFFEKVWRKRYEKIIEPALGNNIPVTFESDGKIDEIVPMLIDMGFSLICPMDSGAVDYKKYKKKYGNKIALGGGIDIRVLTNGSKEDVRNVVVEELKVLKQNGRYIFGSSHSITNNIPWENYIEMMNTFYEFCEY